MTKLCVTVAAAAMLWIGSDAAQAAKQKFQFGSVFWLILPNGQPDLVGPLVGNTVVKGRINTSNGKYRATEKGTTQNQSSNKVDLSNNNDVRNGVAADLEGEVEDSTPAPGDIATVIFSKFKLKVSKKGKVNGRYAGTVTLATPA